jgi:cell division transport system permease protein
MKVPSAPLRASRFDELGLRRALSGLMLPLLVASMTFLAALALGGWIGATSLASQWRDGAGAALTVQVPQPGDAAVRGSGTRLAAATAILAATPGVATVHVLSEAELSDLLRPWLGTGAERVAIPLPAVVAVRLTGDRLDLGPLGRRLEESAPGTMLEDHGVWIRRLSTLAFSLQACALLALALVSTVAAAVIAVATRAGLASRREAIEIVHGLGATDGFIAGRFARRATVLAATGGLIGSGAALPVLLALAVLAAPFTGAAHGIASVADTLSALPPSLWGGVAILPAATASIGFATAQGTVRRWLRRLP